MTLAEGISLFLEPQGLKYRRRVGRVWTGSRASLLRHHIERLIGDVRIEDLCPAHIEHVQRIMQEEGYKPNTINRAAHGALFSLLRNLAANGHLPLGLRERLSGTPRVRMEKSRRAKHFESGERDKALDVCRELYPRYYPLVATLFLTGIRGGEAAGLRQSDCDWTHGGFHVEQSRSGKDITPCKTERSQRWVPWTDDLAAILRPLRNDEDPDAYLFLGKRGAPIDLKTFRRHAWKAILQSAGLPHLVLHGARHTWASIARQCGMPIDEVARQMGDTPEVVTETYIHVAPRFDPNTAVGRPPPDPVPTVIEVVRGRPKTYGHLRLVK